MRLLVQVRPGSGFIERPLVVGHPLSFGRGRDRPVDVQLGYPGLSRRAGLLEVLPDGRLCVSSYQTGAVLEVRRANGITANRLSKGEICVIAPGTYTLEIVGMVGPALRMQVLDDGESAGLRAPSGRPIDADVTEQVLRPELVLSPQRGQEWQLVLALACVLARRDPRVDGWAAPSTKQLASAAGAWFGTVISDKWLSDRLDAALTHLHLPRDGTDKLPRLVSRALAGDLLDARLLDAVEQRLHECEHRPSP